MNERATTTLVVGRRKFGKSTFLRETVLPDCPLPVVVLDVKGEYGANHGFTEIFHDLDAFVEAGPFWRASCRFDLEESSLLFESLYYYSPHVLVVEEAHLYCSPNYIDPSLSKLVRMGGEPGVSLILVSQRVRDFPQIVYSMADKLVVFQQRGVHDVDALGDTLGEDLSELTSLPWGEHRDFEL